MSSLICFPNKLAKPGSGVHSESAFAPGDGSKADVEDGAKRLGESLWASEDMVRDAQAGVGSPEWSAAAADPQRAISLDASECLAEINNPSLVRSAAVEDLTSIGARKRWEESKEDGDGGAGQQDAEAPQSLSQPGFEESSSSRSTSEKESLLTQMPSDTAAENSRGDSSSLPPHRPVYSEPDISNESGMMRSRVAQTTELQKTPPLSSPARKSLVPVPIVKGLFAVMFTKFRTNQPSSVNSSHSLISYNAASSSSASLSCSTLPLNPSYGR